MKKVFDKELIKKYSDENGWIVNHTPEDFLVDGAKQRKAIPVLVSLKNGTVTVVRRINGDERWYYSRVYSSVIAWQPLPQSYRGVSNEIN